MEDLIKSNSTEEGAIKEDALSREIERNYKKCIKHYEGWEKEARQDYKFGLGDQWSKEDREALQEQGRPALTFNRIRPIINIISGYQRENSARIKVNPEGGEDRIFSEVMDRMLKAMDKWSHFSHKAGYWFDDGLFCGKGWLEAVVNYDKDPIRGQIDFKQRTPYQIKVDPDFNDYDLNNGCGFVFKVVRLTKEKMKELYPKKTKLIDGFVKDNDSIVDNGSGILDDGPNNTFEDDNYGNDRTARSSQSISDNDDDLGDGKFTVKEYWRQKMIKKFFVIEKESGEPKKFDEKEKAEEFIALQGWGKVIDRDIPEMWVAAKGCGFILQDEKSALEPYYSGYPFFRFMADWAPNAEEEALRVQGIVRALKDVQVEKNKSKSQYLHMVNTQANSGWVGDEDALTDAGWRKLEQMGSKPGLVIKKKKGMELREILPKGPNQAHLIREEKADEEFKQISNINPDLLGAQTESQSGRAMSIRIKQAVIALTRLFANYRYSKEIVGLFLLQMVPMLFDAKKISRVLGPEYMSKAIDKTKYPQGLTEGVLQAFLQLVKDNKYDVFVAEADQNATIRYEIFQELSELLKAGAPIPPDLLIDYMDLPNSQEVKDKIQEYQQQQAQAAQASGK